MPIYITTTYRDFRAGDVLHALVNISKAKRELGYFPEFRIQGGIQKAMHWHLQFTDNKK